MLGFDSYSNFFEECVQKVHPPALCESTRPISFQQRSMGMEEETQTCKTACGRSLLFAQQLSSYQVISR